MRQVRTLLVSAFRRRLERRGLQALILGWRNIALNQKAEVRTRTQLISALQAQEDLSASLETNMRECNAVLLEAEQVRHHRRKR